MSITLLVLLNLPRELSKKIFFRFLDTSELNTT